MTSYSTRDNNLIAGFNLLQGAAITQLKSHAMCPGHTWEMQKGYRTRTNPTESSTSVNREQHPQKKTDISKSDLNHRITFEENYMKIWNHSKGNYSSLVRICSENGLRRARTILYCYTGTPDTHTKDIMYILRSALHRLNIQTTMESILKWALAFPHPEIEERLRDTLHVKILRLYCNKSPMSMDTDAHNAKSPSHLCPSKLILTNMNPRAQRPKWENEKW